MTTHLSEFSTVTVILALGVWFLFRFVLLSLVLWIMLKVQELNYHIPGLLGSAALASLFDMIPFVGHVIAVPVLLLCVLALTRSPIFDVRFTVAVSYAVMFLMQMLVISALPGTLHVNARTPSLLQTAQNAVAQDNDADEPATNAVTSLTNHPSAARITNAVPKTVAVAQEPGSAAPAKPLVPSAPPAIPAAAPAVPRVKPPIEAVMKFKLKGVVRNGAGSLAIVDTGAKTYSLGIGETQTANTADGQIDFSLVQLTESGAVFRSGGQTTLLRLP